MRCSLVLSVASAGLVYLINSIAPNAPPKTLAGSAAPLLGAMFTGNLERLKSPEDVSLASFIPSPINSDKNAVVYIGNVSDALVEAELGAPLVRLAGIGAIPEVQTKNNIEPSKEVYLDGSSALALLHNVNIPVLVITSEVFTRFPQKQKRASAPFKTRDECSQTTNGCSGHGQCKKRGDFYECVCQRTTENGKTTVWGGKACAKKDISEQVHLLVWPTVAIITAGVFGIKLMLGVGSAPLPGVLSAH